ncbi:MAG: type IX secretion system sortase PorU [Fidelibacterota bacterium]|nr:MAG: type IX secretion system sortase PorU [Candidatus Neomarinimicrobiota bacterium]
MQRIAALLVAILLLSVPALGDDWRNEIIILDVTDEYSQPHVEEGRTYHLSTQTTTIDIEGLSVGIYRWVLSARNTDRVSVRMIGSRWVPVEGDPSSLPTVPDLKVHSPQAWGLIRVVLLDLFPWRIENGRLEILKEARLEVAIHHRPEDSRLDPVSPASLATRIANRILIRAESQARPLQRRLREDIPTGGSWLKIPVRGDALYHLTGSYLSAAGVDLDGLDSRGLRLFAPTSLGRPMPSQVGAPLQDNLTEIAIHVRDGGDNLLNADDDVLFYARGPRGFDLISGEFRYIQNPYTNMAYVWLFIPEGSGSAAGLRMSQGPDYLSSNETVTRGRISYRHEVDIFNGYDSGPVWHETAIGNGTSFTLILPTPNLRTADTTELTVRLRGGNERGSHRVALVLNNVQLTVASGSAHSNMVLSPGINAIASAVATGQNVVTLNNISISDDPREEVWLDWAQIDYGLNLVADENTLTFLTVPFEGPANVEVSGFSSQPLVLDITDPTLPIIQQLSPANNNWKFTTDDLGSRRLYTGATDEQLVEPEIPTYFPELDFTTLRQSTHQADYIILTHASLLAEANDLAAIHSYEVQPERRLSTLVTTVSEVYEEFSGGVADPLAIRAFLRWASENYQQPAPRLVVLFGDGDFDYRNLSGISSNLVPTYQVDGSSEISSRTVDDAFVYLDSIPVSSPLPDMGIGRIAVSLPDEAEQVVDLIRTYMVSPEPGSWRQRILLAADDPVRPNNDEPVFIAETEGLAQSVPPYLQVEKLYLTEYAKILDPATNTVIKPDATEDLIRSVNQGITLINYLGHGGSSQWAQEQLLKMDRDRTRLEPGSRLPVWFAGTCTWGRFDQLQTPSMSEVLSASGEIAAIAVVSAVRAVYASENFRFIRELFSQTFPGLEPSTLRIGEILQRTKSGGDGDEKFHLFGDPAIQVAFPKEPLTLDPISPNTLRALGKTSYSGSTGNGNMAIGECLITVLDAPRQVVREYRTLENSLRSISYSLAGAPIFRGGATVSGGRFQGQFVVPKDISYSYTEKASIIAYAWSQQEGTLFEQIGYQDTLTIQGTDTTISDDIGPLISAFWEDRALVSGDALPEGVQIEVELSDPRGINLTGEVGHAIRLWIDDESTSEVMDPLFQYNTDSHTTGRFPYQFDPTLSGSHELNVEAWDGANNKSVSGLTLHLSLSQEQVVTDVFNFPNPFPAATDFVFTLGIPADVTITIFTLNGIKIRTLEAFASRAGPQRIYWDGRDEFGDQIANGTYLYHFKVDADGQAVTKWGRLARLR